MAELETPRLRTTTLAERKRVETLRRRTAADAIVRDLAAFASEQAGRFVVFGSFAEGAMRHDSDLDLLLDFPVERTADAWTFADDLAVRYDVPIDVHDARTTRSAFVDRVLAKGRVLP